MTSADEMAATARNADPLHDHRDAGEAWTADTMAAHLVHLHGADGAREDMGLEFLAEVHALLRHDPAAPPARREPRRRYSTIGWGQLRTSDNPEDTDLYLASENGTTIICFTPADRALLAAVVSPDTPELRELQDRWAAKLGPGGRHAVSEGHVAGYRLGVRDMEATPAYRTAPPDADDVIGYLTDLAGTPAAMERGMLDALGSVTEFLQLLKDWGGKSS